MNPFARFAFFTMVRDTGFVALAAGTLMVGYSFEPPLAFKIGATVALIFDRVDNPQLFPHRGAAAAQRGLARAATRRASGRRTWAQVGAGAAGRASAALRQSHLCNRRYSLLFGLRASRRAQQPRGFDTVS